MYRSRPKYENTIQKLAVHPLRYKGEHYIPDTPAVHNLVTKTEAYVGAAEDLAKKELKEASDYIHHDLEEFSRNYRASVENFYNTAWYQAFNEAAWNAMELITDITQVEWTEIGDDFQHKGRYHAGEEVGFGVLTCVRCGYKKQLFHPSTLLPCANCDGEVFAREGFEP